MSNNSYDPSDDVFAANLIRRKVNQLVRHGHFQRQDAVDRTQDLYRHILRKMHLFDPLRGDRNAFLRTIVEPKAHDILRRRRAEKRDDRRIVSLHVPIADEDGELAELANVLDESVLDARLGRYRASREETADLVMDVSRVIATLPTAWRTLAELLKTHTLSEASRALQVPRKTLYGRVRGIRRHFGRAGVVIYA